MSYSPSTLTSILASDAYALTVISFGVFVDLLVYSVFIPVLPLIVTDKLGGGPAELGVLIASYAAGLLVGAPVLGVLSDKYHQRKAGMVVGLLGLILSTALYGVAEGYVALVLARIFQGFSGAAVWTLGLSLLADKFSRKTLGAAMGTVMTAQLAGTICGPPLGGMAYRSGGIWGVCGLCMGGAVLDLVLRLLVVEKKETGVSADPDPQVEESPSEVVCKGSAEPKVYPPNYQVASAFEESAGNTTDLPTSPSSTTINVPLSAILRNRLLVLTAVTTILLGTLITSFEPILPIFLRDTFGFDEVFIGLTFLIFGVAGGISSIVAGFLLERLDPRILTIPAALIAAVTICGLAWFTTNVTMTLVLLGIVGASVSVCVMPLLPNVVDAVEGTGGKLALNRAYAIFNMAWSVGILVGPLAGGALLEYAGYRITMICLAAIGLVVIPCAYMALGGSRQSNPL